MINRIYTRTEKSQNIFHEMNEDSRFYGTYFLMNDDRVTVMSVADGVSSAVNSHIASRKAVTGFAEAFHAGLVAEYASAPDGYSISHHLDRVQEIAVKAILASNQRVCENIDEFTPTGTTLSVVVLLNHSMICLNMGDSPVYYFSAKEDEFRLMSVIQTRAEADYLEGKCERYDEAYFKADHIITSALGNMSSGNRALFDEKQICVRIQERLSTGDRILLGTDGCFGRMREEQIWKIVNQSNGHKALKELFEAARKDKNDDQTAILFCLDEEV